MPFFPIVLNRTSSQRKDWLFDNATAPLLLTKFPPNSNQFNRGREAKEIAPAPHFTKSNNTSCSSTL